MKETAGEQEVGNNDSPHTGKSSTKVRVRKSPNEEVPEFKLKNIKIEGVCIIIIVTNCF